MTGLRSRIPVRDVGAPAPNSTGTGTGKSVAATVNRRDHVRGQRLAQGRDMDLQRVLLHNLAGPDSGEKRIFGHDLARPFQQHAEQIEGPPRKLDDPIRPFDPPFLPLQPVWSECRAQFASIS